MLALRGGVPDAFRIEGVAAGGRSLFARARHPAGQLVIHRCRPVIRNGR